MRYAKLGNSDLTVSRICLGSMGFGDPALGPRSWTLAEGPSQEIIQRGIELGINFFDTSPDYQGGTSERYLGRALRDFARQDEVVVATKLLPRSAEEIAQGISARDHVSRMLDQSLRNLGRDQVDLYVLQRWDYSTPILETLEALTEAVQAGKVRFIGIANCLAWQLCKANDLAEQEGLAPFVSFQGRYNLIFREEEREMVPFCREKNIALTPYSPLASGRLSKKASHTSLRLREDSLAQLQYNDTAHLDAPIRSRIAAVAQCRRVSTTEVALAWLLKRVTAPIVGASQACHVEEAVKSLNLELSEDECAYLEELYVPHPLIETTVQKD